MLALQEILKRDFTNTTMAVDIQLGMAYHGKWSIMKHMAPSQMPVNEKAS